MANPRRLSGGVTVQMVTEKAKMPFIRAYSEDEVSEEAKFVGPPRESPMEVALHETIHIVILRLDGLEVADVVEQDEAAWTRLVEPQKFTVAALMAPEVYMGLNNIAFTDLSVSSDRNAVTDCYPPEDVEDIRKDNRALLEMICQCPSVRAAIRVLSESMDNELRKHKVMTGTSIYELIDPILKHSPYANGLRERLNRVDLDPRVDCDI
jgi:hypothetical protein